MCALSRLLKRKWLEFQKTNPPTRHCNSLNSIFLTDRPWLTFTDKGVLMLKA